MNDQNKELLQFGFSKEELVILLRDGKIEEFNRVRPYPSLDLSRVNLSGVNLSMVNLSRTNLSETNLARTNLLGSDFSESDLTLTNFWGANFYGVRGLTLRHRELIIAQLKKSWEDSII